MLYSSYGKTNFGAAAPPPWTLLPVFAEVVILQVVKVVCFHILLQVLILKLVACLGLRWRDELAATSANATHGSVSALVL
jgi:hypothetical protein